MMRVAIICQPGRSFSTPNYSCPSLLPSSNCDCSAASQIHVAFRFVYRLRPTISIRSVCGLILLPQPPYTPCPKARCDSHFALLARCGGIPTRARISKHAEPSAAHRSSTHRSPGSCPWTCTQRGFRRHIHSDLRRATFHLPPSGRRL